MTNPSFDFCYDIYFKFLSAVAMATPILGQKYSFLVTKLLYLRMDIKHLGAFNCKPVLSYPGSFLVTLVYNIIRGSDNAQMCVLYAL